MHRRSLLAVATAATTGCLGLPFGGIDLKASTDTVTLPRDTIRFTLENAGLGAVETNLADWHLHKRVDGRWYPLFPFGRTDATTRLDGRSSHTWTLAIDNEDRELLDALPRWTADRVAVAGLGAGRYRFVHRDDGAAPTKRSAAFRAEGDTLALATDPDVAVSEEGDGLAIRDGDPSSGASATIVVERSSAGSGDAQRLIAEQVVRVRPLRNMVPVLEDRGRDRARYRGAQGAARRIQILDDYLGLEPGDARRFRYRDGVYIVRVQDEGDGEPGHGSVRGGSE